MPVLALSKLFRAELQSSLKIMLLKYITPSLIKSGTIKWVVNCKAVGTGEKAVQYLSEYVFRPAISNNRILSMDNNTVTFNYIDNKTQVNKTMKLSSEEFIRRYLQHVLPKGFVKVRYFGLFASTNRKLLAEVNVNLSAVQSKNNDDLLSENRRKT